MSRQVAPPTQKAMLSRREIGLHELTCKRDEKIR